MIDYCEKENIKKLIILRQKSVNGITKKYNWDFITKQYLEFLNL